MEFIDINMPTKPQNSNGMFGTIVQPIQKLRIMSDTEFEDMVMEWAYSYLKNKYSNVRRIGGAGDKGRDIVGYYDDGSFDIYQCKHYASPLIPSKYWVEFGKLCYYTYHNHYGIPKKYFIVASSGIGESLNEYLLNPGTINNALIENWDTHCKTKITQTESIELVGNFKDYVSRFDFSIVKQLSEIALLDQYSSTPWFKYRFGGGLMKKPRAEVLPETISDAEKKLEYFKELIEVYEELTLGDVRDLDTLNSNKKLNDHFTRQRISYHSSQALKRFSRDELLNEEIYEEIKDQVYYSVVDISQEAYENSYMRLNETLREARRLSLANDELGNISPIDRCGMCHELVNDKKLSWVSVYAEC